MKTRTLTLYAALAVIGISSTAALAADFFVAPNGAAANAGTRESPWDIASALEAAGKVKPGDTINLLAGTYRRRPNDLFEVRLAGSAAAPIQVRPAPGARATIDGGLAVQAPSAHVWIRDLEIIVSENFTMPREVKQPGSSPGDYNRPWGGLNLHGGSDCKFIHLVIHHCAQGISAWVGAENAEMYGCLIYENGWKAPDRGHGHSIYTQNQKGTKTIKHCIMSAAFEGSYTVHAYGSSRAYVDNFLVEENICYGIGPFLIGGGRPSSGIRALKNVLFSVPMRIGYAAPHNEDCEVRGNLIVNGGLEIKDFKKVVNEENRVIGEKDARPKGREAIWFPSAYDPSRAHLAVFNWEKRSEVAVDATSFLAPGARFRCLDPKDFFGAPIATGTCEGGAIKLPCRGEFAAFVVLKEPAGTR